MNYVIDIDNFLCFKNMSVGLPLSIPLDSYKTRSQLGSYLAGLIEGDGYIYVPLSNRNTNINLYAHIEICFSIKDINLALNIKEKIGGYITSRSEYCILLVKSKKSLFNFLTLINGYFL